MVCLCVVFSSVWGLKVENAVYYSSSVALCGSGWSFGKPWVLEESGQPGTMWYNISVFQRCEVVKDTSAGLLWVTRSLKRMRVVALEFPSYALIHYFLWTINTSHHWRDLSQFWIVLPARWSPDRARTCLDLSGLSGRYYRRVCSHFVLNNKLRCSCCTCSLSSVRAV